MANVMQHGATKAENEKRKKKEMKKKKKETEICWFGLKSTRKKERCTEMKVFPNVEQS